jgi:hypothetical protein
MTERVTFEAYLEDHMSSGFNKIEKTGMKAYGKVDREQEEVIRNTKKIRGETDMLGQSFRKLGPILGGIAVGAMAKQWGEEIIQTTAKFEKFEAVLTNTFGDRGKARESFEMIKNFGANTPFQVDELTDSYVKLVNDGFKPTRKELTALGDIAASRGKSFKQLTEGIIDAGVGEWERMKEFGIRAQQQGDQVAVTFKGQTKVIDNTQQAIRDYVISLGKAQGVSGAMAKISKTTGGQISNLRDKVDELNYALGQRFKPITESALKGTSNLVETFKDWVEVPLSEELRDEQVEVNNLTHQLMNQETPQERRLELYNKLHEIAPEVLNDIDKEDVKTGNLADNYERLADNLEKYNKAQVYRIIREEKEEELKNVMEDIAGEQGRYEELKQKEIQKAYAARADIQKQIETRGGDAMLGDSRMTLQKASDILQEQLQKGGMETIKGLYQYTNTGLLRNTDLSAEMLRRVAQSKQDVVREKSRNEAKIERLNRTIAEYKERLGGMFANDTNDNPDDNNDDGSGSGGDGGDGEDTSASKALASISGDRRKVTSLTIKIDRQLAIENVNMTEESQEETIEEFTEKLQTALQNVVNDAAEMSY